MICELEIINNLFNIYMTEETWHKFRLAYGDFYHYKKILIDRGNLFWIEKDNNIVGYIEVLKINYEQLGRLVCDELFYVDIEDTISGNIAWVHNFWIDSKERSGEVIKLMKEPYYKIIHNCDYITGRHNKHNEAVRIYKNPLKLSKIGANNGNN